jgi:hypothetical protein
MNGYDIARRVVQEWILALLCLLLAVVVALVATYQISLSPFSLHPKALQMGVSNESVLVDTRDSQIGSARPAAARVGNLGTTFTDLVNTQPVIGPVARALHVKPSEVGVQTQITAQTPLSQRLPLEPQVGTEILATQHHYYIVARNDSGTPLIQLFTQAPTAAQARLMATTAAQALARFADNRAQQGHIAKVGRVDLRVIGTVGSGTLARGVSRDAAILIAIGVWLLAFIGGCTVKASARRSRERRALEASLSEA